MNGKGLLVLAGFFGLAIYAASSGHHNAEPTHYAAASTYTAPAVAYTASEPPPPTTYTVVYGDTLYNIAVAHHVTLAALIQANGFANSWVPINPGDPLQLPTPTDTSGTSSPTPTVMAAATAPVRATGPAPTYYQGPPPTYQAPAHALSPDWAATCPNGSCYGDTSPVTGQPKTTYVRPYDRKDGTHVGGYYRSHH